MDVSYCLTFCDESLLAVRTLRNVSEQIRLALDRGHRVELLLHLDGDDEETAQVVREFASYPVPPTIITNDFGDAAKSRNALLDLATGDFVAFCDGDDLFTANWLYAALETARAQGVEAIYSPAFRISFHHAGLLPIAMLSGSADHAPVTNAAVNNPIQVANLVSRSVYDRIRYRPNDHLHGFEDWRWALDALAAGTPIVVVPHTVFFYRAKSRSARNQEHTHGGSTVGRTPFLSPEVFAALPHRSAPESNDLLPRPEPSPLPQRTAEQVSAVDAVRFEMLGRLGNGPLFEHGARVASATLRRLSTLRGGEPARTVPTQSTAPDPHVAGFPYEWLLQTAEFEPLLAGPVPCDPTGRHTLTYQSEPSVIKDLYRELCERAGSATDLVVLGSLNPLSEQESLALIDTIAAPDRDLLVIGERLTDCFHLSLAERSLTGWSLAEWRRELSEYVTPLTMLAENWPKLRSLTLAPCTLTRQLLVKHGRQLRAALPITVLAGEAAFADGSFTQLAEVLTTADRVVVTSPRRQREVCLLLGREPELIG